MKNFGQILYAAVFIIVCAAVGNRIEGAGLVGVLAVFAMLAVWYVLNRLIWMFGCTLMSAFQGYRVVTVNLGNRLWIRGRKGIFHHIGRGFNIRMEPPAAQDGKYPYVSYGIGGYAANALVTLLCYLLRVELFFDIGWMLGLGMLALNTTSLYSYLRVQRQHPSVRRALWINSMIWAREMQNVGLRDQPDEWFEMSSDEELKLPYVPTLAVYACLRMMMQGNFEGAERECDWLLRLETAMTDYTRRVMISERIACLLLDRERHPEAFKLADCVEMEFMEQYSDALEYLRVRYGVALLLDRDAAKAKAILDRFQRIVIRYPDADHVAFERNIMQRYDEIAEEMSE